MKLITTAQKILMEYLGASATLHIQTKLQSSYRTQVYRCSVQSQHQNAPATVIVKQSTQPYGTLFEGGADGNTWQEWAGLQFLQELTFDNSISPQCYGGDRSSGLIVLEDLGEQLRLDDVLAGDDYAAAEEALVRYFAMLGDLHSRTMGYNSRFGAIRASLGSYNPKLDWYWQRIAKTPLLFNEIARLVDIPVSATVRDDLATIVSTLHKPEPFFTFIHGDPTPTNALLVHSVPKFIDFEFCTYGHALLDAVQARIPFPTGSFVNRIPPSIVESIEEAYQTQLNHSFPGIIDDGTFNEGIAVASAYWAINFLSWLPFSEVMQADRVWGIATLRQRYLYFFEVTAQTCEESGYLEAFGHAIKSISAKLQVLWSDTESLPLYPAFRESSCSDRSL